MAFIKVIPTDFGIDATYWVVGVIEEDFKGKSITVTLHGYVNAAARASNKLPIAATKFQLNDIDYIQDATRGNIYVATLKRPEFADAENA